MDEQSPDVQQTDSSPDTAAQPSAPPPAPASTPAPPPVPQSAGPMPVPQGATLRPVGGAMPVPQGATLRPVGVKSSTPAVAPKSSTHIDPRTGTEQPGALPGEDIGSIGRGFEKEAIKTAGGLAGLANKVLPNSMQIPMPTPAETDTKGVGETVGGLGENAAEWAGGEEALKGLAAMTKVPEAVLAMAEKYPRIAKLLTGAAKAATVGGVQGAVKGAESGQTLEGAKGGAEGGAIGGTLGETVGGIVKPVAEKLGFATSGTEDAIRAAKPSKWNTRFIGDWEKAAPILKEEMAGADGGKYKSVTEAADRIDAIRNNYWDKTVKPALEQHAGDNLDTLSVNKAIHDSADEMMREHAPEQAAIVDDFAKRFAGGMKLSKAEDTIEHFNAELNNAGYYDLPPDKRAARVRADGFTAARVAALDSLRDAIYDHLSEDPNLPDMREAKKTYGALANVSKAVRGQSMVSARQQPISLKQIIGGVAGIAHGGLSGATAAALPVLDKLYNSPESLLTRAVEKTAPSAARQAVNAAAPKVGAAAKTAAKVIGATTGENMAAPNHDWHTVKASDGKMYRIHPEDLPKAQELNPNLQPLQP